jgi:hypothetical protein
VKKLAAVAVTLLLAAGLSAPGIGPAAASPTVISPASGTEIPSNAQVFHWGESGAQGSVWNYYLEISTRPDTDYYNYGFFYSQNIVYSSPSTTNTSINIGNTLAPGTYYYHVLGKYGLYGANGTAWTPVTSFNVYSNVAVAPAIGLNPTALTITVPQQPSSTAVWTESPTQVNITNTGGSTLSFSVAGDGALWQSFLFGTNDGAIQKLRVAVNPHPTAGLNLVPGRYQATIHVTDNGSSPPATNSPQNISVTMNVVAADSAAPTGASVSAPSFTATPLITLTVAATDVGSGVAEMRLRADSGAWGTWAPFAASQQFALPDSEGQHTVGLQVRDHLGNTAAEVTDTVIYDKSAPTGVSVSAPAFTGAALISLAVTASDSGSGVAEMRLRADSGSWGSWQPYSAGPSISLPATEGQHTVGLQVRDHAGNTSTEVTDTVGYDTTAPSGGVTTVASTAIAQVGLTVAATDALSGVWQMSLHNDAQGWGAWQAYATSLAWILPPTPGLHTVHVRFRDHAGNVAEGTPASVTITAPPPPPPSAPSLTAPAVSTLLSGAAAVVLRWTPGSNAGAGLAGMQLRSRSLPAGTWTAWGATRVGTSATVPAAAGGTYEYQIRAMDLLGQASAPSASRRSIVPFDQGVALYGGKWSTRAQTGAFRGAVRRSTARGASASLRRLGRSFGVVVTTGPGRGGAAVYIDGRLARVVSTFAVTTHVRTSVVIKTLARAGLHTVKVVNLATPGRPAVELDGFIVGQ